MSSYHMHCFGTLVRNQLLVLVGCFWVLNFVSLNYLSIHSLDYYRYITVFQSWVWFLPLNFHSCLAILFFIFSYKFKNNVVYSYKNLAGVFIGITLNLYINLGRIDFFTMLSHPWSQYVSLSFLIFHFFISIVWFSACKSYTGFVRFIFVCVCVSINQALYLCIYVFIISDYKLQCIFHFGFCQLIEIQWIFVHWSSILLSYWICFLVLGNFYRFLGFSI